MNLTFGYNLGCAFYASSTTAYKAANPTQIEYNCPSTANYQTCTNDFMALGMCTSSSGLLVDGNTMAQAYSNGNCKVTANADSSGWPSRGRACCCLAMHLALLPA